MAGNDALRALVEFLRRAQNDLLRETAGGDPDGAPVPLPRRDPPERVVSAFPLSAYRALVGMAALAFGLAGCAVDMYRPAAGVEPRMGVYEANRACIPEVRAVRERYADLALPGMALTGLALTSPYGQAKIAAVSEAADRCMAGYGWERRS